MEISVLLRLTVLATLANSDTLQLLAKSDLVEGACGHGKQRSYEPNFDDSNEWIYVSASVPNFNLANRKPTDVIFYLYTKTNPLQPQQIERSYYSIDSSNFNNNHPTRFITHGWRENYVAKLNTLVRDAWLSKGEYNIIVVDWSFRSISLNYFESANYVSAVGEKVADMIDFLHSEFEMPFDSLILIGHSLGAHVSGFAGKSVKKGTVHTIVGLDPAMPLFSLLKPERRLLASDAYYVESIHTNAGKLGMLHPVGRIAFYPNGGRNQPGCGLDYLNTCSHSRSYKYYAEAVIRNSFPSIKCEHLFDALNKECGSNYSSVHMGAVTNALIHSKRALTFFVPVNAEAPFGKSVQL